MTCVYHPYVEHVQPTAALRFNNFYVPHHIIYTIQYYDLFSLNSLVTPPFLDCPALKVPPYRRQLNLQSTWCTKLPDLYLHQHRFEHTLHLFLLNLVACLLILLRCYFSRSSFFPFSRPQHHVSADINANTCNHRSKPAFWYKL